MAKNTNKDIGKNPVVEEILNTPVPGEAPPDPALNLTAVLAKDKDDLTAVEMDFLSDNKDNLTDEQKVAVGLMDPSEINEPTPPTPPETPPEPPVDTPPTPPVHVETQEEKDQKYRNQQAEASILAAKNKEIAEKMDEAAKLADPTEEEMRVHLRVDGIDWDELTASEKLQWKRTLTSEKKLALVTQAIDNGRKVDEWATTVDTFIDTTDGKPAYVQLSGNESEFRKYCMQPTHRGTDMQLLVESFMYTHPAAPKKRGELFPRGGGGERPVVKDGVTDAEEVARLRTEDPREYKRQIQMGKIKLEV